MNNISKWLLVTGGNRIVVDTAWEIAVEAAEILGYDIPERPALEWSPFNVAGVIVPGAFFPEWEDRNVHPQHDTAAGISNHADTGT